MQGFLTFNPINDTKTHEYSYIHARKRGNSKLYLLSLFPLFPYITLKKKTFLPVLPMEILTLFAHFIHDLLSE